MESQDQYQPIVRKVREDFVERSEQGIFGHPLCMLLVLLTTQLFTRLPLVMWSGFALLLVQMGARLIAIRRLRSPALRHKTSVWEIIHTGSVLCCAGVWGLIPAVAIVRLGYHDQDTLVLLLYHAAIAFATVNVLVHDIRLIGVSLALLFVPPIGAQFVFGAHQWWGPVLAFLFYLIYLTIEGKKLNVLYRQQVADHHELTLAAHHDYLTRLPNRLYLHRALEDSLSRAALAGKQLALLYIDFDGFKRINDTFSHRVGDLFLCEIAKRLKSCVQSSGTAARIGGDEFVILLSDCESREEAAETARSVLAAARKPLVIEGHRLVYSASIGISMFPSDGATPELLIRAADQAMYAAKSAGKNQIGECIACAG